MNNWLDNFTSTVKDWLANAMRNPKTTALGIAAVVGSVKGLIADPSVIGEAWWWASMFASLGLLTAKDGTTSGTVKTEKDEKE